MTKKKTKRNPSTRPGLMPYAAVLNDGGFSFGMDRVTPVSWKLGYSKKQIKLGRKFYNAFWIPNTAKTRAFIKAHRSGWHGTFNELREKLRP